MHALAHQRPEVLDVQLEHRVAALPANHVERTKIVEDGRVRAASFDPQLPLVTLLGHRPGLGHFDHVIVKRRVMADAGPVGEADRTARLDDQREVVAAVRHQAVARPLGDHQIVALDIRQRPKIALQHAPALVNEVDLVAVAIAEAVRHRLRALRDGQTHVVVVQHLARFAARVVAVGRRQVVGVKGPRPQRPLNPLPVGWRMGVVELAGRTKEALPAVLLFVQPLGNGDVGLLGNGAFCVLDFHAGLLICAAERACRSGPARPGSAAGADRQSRPAGSRW